MSRHEANCHLEYVRLYLAISEKDKAQESLAKAKELIDTMGMHRWDFETKGFEARLHETPH